MRQSMFAQADSVQHKKYQVKIKFNSTPLYPKSKPPYIGELFETTDSTLILRMKYSSNELTLEETSDYRFPNIPVSSISVIKLYKKGNAGKGILIGFLSGFAAGIILDLITYKSCDELYPNGGNHCIEIYSRGESLMISGMLLAIPGAIIGAIAGTAKIVYPIGGKQENYIRHRKQLIEYSIMNK